MALSDCVVPSSTEVVDTTLTVTGMTFSPAMLPSTGVQQPAVTAVWSAPTNPAVTAIQFSYQQSDLSQGQTNAGSQQASTLAWTGTDGVVAGKGYYVMWRAVGNGVFGSWSTPILVTIPSQAVVTVGGSSMSGGVQQLVITGNDPATGLYAGGTSPASAPTTIQLDGTVMTRLFQLMFADGSPMIDQTGPSAAFRNMILSTVAGVPLTDKIQGSVTLGASAGAGSSATLNIGADSTVQIDMLMPFGDALGAVYTDFPATLTLTIYERFSSNNGGSWGSWTAVSGGAKSLTKISTGVPTSSQYKVLAKSISYWDADAGTYVTSNTAVISAPASMSLTVSAAAKPAGLYQYCVVETTGAPLAASCGLTFTDTDGAGSFIVSGTAAIGSVNGPYAAAWYSNLKIAQLSSSLLTCAITADFVTVVTPSAICRTIGALSATLDLSTTGAGKLDTGSVAASTVYAIWAISTGTVDGVLASLSFTSPAMPSGYTYKKLIGMLRTTAANKIWPFEQANDEGQFVNTTTDALPIIFTGTLGTPSATPPTYSSTGMDAWISPVATAAFVLAHTNGSNGMYIAPNTSYGNNGSANPPPIVGKGQTGYGSGWIKLEDRNLYAYCSDGSGRGRLFQYKLAI